MNIVSKVTGDSLTANEFNQIPDELENLITSAGIAPNDLFLNQVGSAVAQYSNDGDFYTTSGTANDIILSALTGKYSPLNLTNGLKVRFLATENNTSSVTINVANLGAKSLKYHNSNLVANSLSKGNYYSATYNSSTDSFVLDEGLQIQIYNNVAELKNDSNAVVGSICQTKGYYTNNDGGQSFYIIREKTVSDIDNGGSILEITGGELVAEILTINGEICVKQFGAKGDNLNDDTQAIQNAINYITDTEFDKIWVGGVINYSKGGGTLHFTSGKYRITHTLLLGQHIRLVGCSTHGFNYPVNDDKGSTIIADFTNPNSWVIDTAIYKSDGTTIGYQGQHKGSQIDNAEINSAHGIIIENLYIKANTSIYGGIRMSACPNSSLRNVMVNGTDIGFYFNCCWDVNAENIMSLSYLYGCLAMYDVNSCRFTGYFNRIAGKSIDADNRMINGSDFGTSVGLLSGNINWSYGFIGYYCNAINLDKVCTEGWEGGRLYVHCEGLVDNSSYLERISEANYSFVTCVGTINAFWGYTPDVNNGYVIGFNNRLTFIGCPPNSIAGTQNMSSNFIVSNNADHFNWKYDDDINYIGTPNNIIKVASDGVANNIANTEKYTTMAEAFRRIVKHKEIQEWIILLKEGDTIDLPSINIYEVAGANPYNGSKKITFRREYTNSSLANPILHLLQSNDLRTILETRVSGNVELNYVGVDFQFPSTAPAINDERGLIFPYQHNATNLTISFTNCSIDLGNGWSLMQQGYNASINIIASFKGCTITGVNTSSLQAPAYASTGHTNVICSQQGCTISSSIIALGTNGWQNSNVIASNFA
jgi:hypothetical protein